MIFLLYCSIILTTKATRILLSTQTYQRERCELQTALENILYTCGAQLQELEFTGRLKDVYSLPGTYLVRIPLKNCDVRPSMHQYVCIVQLTWIQTQRITTPNI